jgi:MFS family permease
MARSASALDTPPVVQPADGRAGPTASDDARIAASAELTRSAHAAVQRRVLVVLAAAQVFGGIGVAAGAAVGALLAADLSADAYSGVAAAASVIGAAIVAIPVTRLMDAHGRRPGLLLAYAVGTIGALTIIGGALLGFFPLALLGLVLTGGGTTATLQSRYAATDLAGKARRGRSLAIVVWATTIGSVLGPNLAAPMGRLAEQVGVPRLAGPYLLTVVVFLIAAALIAILLRPDPLIVARAADGYPKEGSSVARERRSIRTGLDRILASPARRLGFFAVVIGQAVMVAVMSMTPVHLHHADASLRVIGVVISLHIFGMYAASPIVGWAADRWGRRPVIGAGSAVLMLSFAVAGTASGHQTPQLAIGLALLGLGWSCTMIAGSTLLTDATPLGQRPNVQGTTDILMGVGGAAAGLISGVIVGFGTYSALTILTAVLVLGLVLILVQTPLTGPVTVTGDAGAD